MQLIEGKTYRFKQLCELRKARNFTPQGEMDYLAGTTVVACNLTRANDFRIPSLDKDGCFWVINGTMLEEICEEDPVVHQCIVVYPSGSIIAYVDEAKALEGISKKIEGGAKGTYRMYQLYQEVETPKLDISGMIRKIVDKILPKAD